MADKITKQAAQAVANPPPLAQVPNAQPPEVSQLWRQHEHTILVLQGGGALGAYQAGVYTGLEEAGMDVDWVVGVSIGALNAALIAGNPPGRRVERLREFRDRVSVHLPFSLSSSLTLMRPLANRTNAASVIAFGVPGFFVPRTVQPMLAPVAALPVREIVSGVHILSDLTLGLGTVVYDYLER